MLLSSQICEMTSEESIPILLITDNESMANAVRSTTSIEEKRLRVDISALREMIDRKEIEHVGLIPSEHQLADCLTKQGSKPDRLYAVIKQQMRFNHTLLRFMPVRHE